MARSPHAHVLATALTAAVAVVAAASSATAAPPSSGTTINSGPTNGSSVASTSASFTFSDKGHPQATFTCKLDAAAAATCTSPKSYSALAQGSHTFTVT